MYLPAGNLLLHLPAGITTKDNRKEVCILIRLRQYVLQSEGLNSWWDFRMPVDDMEVSLFELPIHLRRYRFAMMLIRILTRYRRIFIFRNGICLVNRFGLLVTRQNPELPIPDIHPTITFDIGGKEWYVEEFGSALVIGNVDVNKLKAKLDRLEEKWRKNYHKTQKRDIKIYLKQIQNADPEFDKKFWDIYQRI